MSKAFILVNIKSGSETNVGKRLKALKNCSEIHFIYGVYDYILMVTAPSTTELKQSVIELRKIPEITSTLTMMIIE